jgi:hypothetical protein
VKRQLSGAAAAIAIVAAGVLASACDITPPAATANGATISTATLNTQLQTLETTTAGGCLLQLENAQLAATSGEGAGGPGTFSMTFANTVLNSQVGALLAGQYAASKGITVTSADLATAETDYQSTLSGEINAAVQQASSSGTPPDPASPGRHSWPSCRRRSGPPRSTTRRSTRSCWPGGPTSPTPRWPPTTSPTCRSSPRRV